MKRKNIIEWIPSLISMVLAIGSAIAYTFVAKPPLLIYYLQIFGAALAPIIVPLYGLLTKKKLPTIVGFLLSIHIFISVDLGNALDFYHLIPLWDKILHTFFGILGAVIVSILLVRWRGDRLKPICFYIVVTLAVLGLGACWEIFEYACDTLLGNDAQRWHVLLEQGKSPMTDTMWDLIVTLIGSLIYAIVMTFDKIRGGKIAKIIYKGQIEEE